VTLAIFLLAVIEIWGFSLPDKSYYYTALPEFTDILLLEL